MTSVQCSRRSLGQCRPARASIRGIEPNALRTGIHPTLLRNLLDQFNATVPISVPQPGDLVFFANTYQPGISHVGIYIGKGLQINAPTTGQFVSVASVFTGYWGAHYAGAHRVRT